MTTFVVNKCYLLGFISTGQDFQERTSKDVTSNHIYFSLEAHVEDDYTELLRSADTSCTAKQSD